MEKLKEIYTGMNGAKVSESINNNMTQIQKTIAELEATIKDLKAKVIQTDTIVNNLDYTTNVVISALPESLVLNYSTETQIIEIPISVYSSNNELLYGVDDGVNTYSVDLCNNTLYDENNRLLAKVSSKKDNDKLVLKVTISPSISGSFVYRFQVTFNGVTYSKGISINVMEKENESSLQVSLSPSTIILQEDGKTKNISLDNAYTLYSAYLGSQDVTKNCTCEITSQSTGNCTATLDTTNCRIKIQSLNTNYANGCQRFEWTDINGVQHSEFKAVNGFVNILFTYLDSNNVKHQQLKRFDFVINHLGTFKESIVNDVHSMVSEKVVQELDSEGKLLTESTKTEIIQSANDVAIKASKETASGMTQSQLQIQSDKIQQTVNNTVSGMTSQITQLSDQVTQTVSNMNGQNTKINQTVSGLTLVQEGLNRSGINLSDGTVTVKANTFKVQDNNGTNIAVFNSQGGLSAGVINASNITASSIDVTGSDGSSVKITSDGKLQAKKAELEECEISGKVHSNLYLGTQRNIQEFGTINGDTMKVLDFNTYPCTVLNISQAGIPFYSYCLPLSSQYIGLEITCIGHMETRNGTASLSSKEDSPFIVYYSGAASLTDYGSTATFTNLSTVATTFKILATQEGWLITSLTGSLFLNNNSSDYKVFRADGTLASIS